MQVNKINFILSDEYLTNQGIDCYFRDCKTQTD